MKKIFLVLSLLFVHWTAYSQQTMEEINRNWMEEQAKSRKIFAECRFALAAKIAPKYNNGIIPAVKKAKVSEERWQGMAPLTSKVGQFSMLFFPPAGILVPFAFLADVLMSPYNGVKALIEKREIKKKLKVSEEKFINDTIAFKKEWDKIEPNKFKQHMLINELYVLQFVSDVHNYLVHATPGSGYSAGNRDNYEFIIPYIYKAIDQKPKFENGEWKIYVANDRRYLSLDNYFHIDDFIQILKDNPKLCSSPGLDALEVIGNGYGKIIKPKTLKRR